ncbi:MAG TPA: protein YgfX [Gallionella sp.]|jgi:hypothetical protein|nr:protein YgfX [Gallionella sp.]
MAIRPSARFAVVLLLSHAIAASVVYMTAMPWAARLVVSLLILLSLSYYLARDIFLVFPYSWHEILLDQGGVSVIVQNGSKLTGWVAGKTIVSPYFVLLCIRPEGRYRPVSRVIFPDAMDGNAFRELRVGLKFAV